MYKYNKYYGYINEQILKAAYDFPVMCNAGSPTGAQAMQMGTSSPSTQTGKLAKAKFQIGDRVVIVFKHSTWGGDDMYDNTDAEVISLDPPDSAAPSYLISAYDGTRRSYGIESSLMHYHEYYKCSPPTSSPTPTSSHVGSNTKIPNFSCTHIWEPITLLTSIVENCSKCKIAKEDA